MKYVFSDQQLSSIILGLEKGDVPIKYTYMTKSGAEARSKLEKKRTKIGQSFADAALLVNSIEIYLQELGNPKEIAIFDFGCGTGETIKATLKKLGNIGIHVNYHAFDISEHIIVLCKKNLSSIKNCSFNHSLIDFETTNLVNILYAIRSQYSNIPVLGLLLGNTVGNFNSMERVISNILEACRLEDKLVIGIERADIQNRRRYDDMIRSYKQKDVFEFVFATLKEIGFSRNYGTLEPIFKERTNTIELIFTIKKKIVITINKQKIQFNKGEKIRVAQSKKIDESGFSKLFLDLDLRIANIRTNESNSYLQALISSKKH